MDIWRLDGPFRFGSVVVPPLIVAALAWVVLLLPSEVINFFTAWLVISFPIGILIGHCMASERRSADC